MFIRSLPFVALGLVLSSLLGVASIDASSASYYVRTIPGLPDDADLRQHAGHITVDETINASIFFWLIHSRHVADRRKFIIWLNGGPGCSSMDGLFMEVGPWRMNEDQTLRLTEGWNEYASVLFVDQPAGTGFSYISTNNYLTNMTQVTNHFMIFLDKFFAIFPQFANDDMYLTGESYAGTYIPYFATAILKRNGMRNTVEDLKYNLKGIAIGNGWIDPLAQYNSYYEFAVEKKLIAGDDQANVKKLLDKCIETEKVTNRIHDDSCELVLQTILDSTVKRFGKTSKECINQYDIRLSDDYPLCGMNWPSDLKIIKEYLRRPDLITAINAYEKQEGWTECSHYVGRALDDDGSAPAVTLLPDLLKQINVLLFSGDQDLICNINGTEDMIKSLEWNGATGWVNDVNEQDWYVDGALAGKWKTARHLTFAIIYNGSHMVGYDAPKTTTAMINKFLELDFSFVNNSQSTIGNKNITHDDKTNEDDDEIWNQYYNAGTATLIIVVCGAVCICAFVFRKRYLQNKKRKGQAIKTATEDENNELTELVIATPLYQADDIDHFGDSEDEAEQTEQHPSMTPSTEMLAQTGSYHDDDIEDDSQHDASDKKA